MYVVATLFVVFFAGGWLFVLGGVLFIAVTTALSPPDAVAGIHVERRRLWETAAASGVLGLNGIPRRRNARLRRGLGRVLQLAPAGTRPKACACINQSNGEYVGVMRLFNRQGHFLLRERGSSPAQVARRFTSNLGRHRDAFPVEVGSKRQLCPECDPRACPLRRAARGSLVSRHRRSPEQVRATSHSRAI